MLPDLSSSSWPPTRGSGPGRAESIPDTSTSSRGRARCMVAAPSRPPYIRAPVESTTLYRRQVRAASRRIACSRPSLAEDLVSPLDQLDEDRGIGARRLLALGGGRQDW